MAASVLNAIDLIPSSGSKYSNELKMQAATLYLTLGNARKTAQAINIPERTLHDWIVSEWWAELSTVLRVEKSQEIDAGFTRIIQKSMACIEAQLEKDQVKARDAATIMGITFDKRQVLNNRPTSISSKAIDIKDLQSKFNDLLDARVINGELDNT